MTFAHHVLLLSPLLFCLACTPKVHKDLDGVPCPGASLEQLKTPKSPGVLRGTVQFVPLAPESASLLLPHAHALTLEQEEPVAGANIWLHDLDQDGRPWGPTLQRTTTDAKGRWCLAISSSEWRSDYSKWQGKTMLIASHQKRESRLMVWFDFDPDLSAQTEALMQLLERKKINPRTIPPETWLNIRTIADSRAGLLSPPAPQKTHQDLVNAILTTLDKDPRLTTLLQSL